MRGTAQIPNVSGVSVTDDARLVLTGGLFGSVMDHALVRVDRTYFESPTPYHRMLDALWAEAHGHAERAKRLFSEAIDTSGETVFPVSSRAAFRTGKRCGPPVRVRGSEAADGVRPGAA